MKRIILFSCLYLFSALVLVGQNSYLKLIAQGKIDKADKKLSENLLKNPDDIELNYTKAVLLNNRNYSGYNPEKSYEFLIKSKTDYEKLIDAKEIKSLNKVPINKEIFKAWIDSICKNALNDALQKDDLEIYQKYLDYYGLCPENYKNLAIEKRNNAAFRVASGDNTIQSYKDFISKYPASIEVNQAWERIHELAYNEAKLKNTSQAYKAFIDDYPQSTQYDGAFKLYEERQFYENTSDGTWENYCYFLENFSENHWKEVASDSIFEIAIRTKEFPKLEYGAEKLTGLKRDSVLIVYHDLYTNDGESQTLDLFYNKYNEDALTDIKTKDYELAELGDQLMLFNAYNPKDFDKYDEYIRKAAPLEKAFVVLLRLISLEVSKKNWKAAIDKINIYAPYFGKDNKKIQNLISLFEGKIDNTIKINNLGGGVNSVKGGEYVPVISADDKLLYFCGNGRNDNIGGEDIFVSKKSGGVWGQAKVVADFSSKYSNDAPLSITSDGTKMILFNSGKIFYAEKTDKGWAEAVEFNQDVNSGDWQADAMISSDGKALLFTSIREGGYNLNISTFKYKPYHGDGLHASDIYVSLLDDNGEWGKPMNIGKTINTQYCERMPFIHPDMKTLYFSSDGHGGLGKLDVFKSTRLADSCWDCWSEPVNMGKEINTIDTDWGYKISTDGEKAYFSKGKDAADAGDIYWLNLPISMRPELVATISGKLLDKEKQPISAEIRWEDLETGKNVGQSKSDPEDGSFFIVLPQGKIYGYYVDKEGYFPISNNIDLRNSKKPMQVEENIPMVSFKQMVEEGTAVQINNLFFNFASSTILSFSIPELKRVAKLLKVGNLKLEISGHTDNIGEEDKNLKLSEDRAKAVKEFLVKEGCLADNLIVVGYGETKPIASNDNEKDRGKNRRVELRFVE